MDRAFWFTRPDVLALASGAERIAARLADLPVRLVPAAPAPQARRAGQAANCYLTEGHLLRFSEHDPAERSDV